MSQVRKFNTGGAAPTSLFDAGGRNVDKDDLIYFAKKNKSVLLSNNGIFGDDATAVSGAYDELVKNIDEGNIKSMDLNGGLIDSTGELANASKSNPAYETATALLGLIVSRMNTTSAIDNKDKKYTDTNGLLDILNKEFYGGQYKGSESDLKLWMNLDTKDDSGIYTRTGRMNKLADLIDIYLKDLNDKNYNYEGSSFTDKNDHISKLTNARDLLKKGEYNDDVIRSLMSLGMTSAQAMTLLTDGSESIKTDETTEVKTPTREEAIKAKVDELVKAGVDESKARELAEKTYDKEISDNNKQVDLQIQDIDFNSWLDPLNEAFTDYSYDITGNTENYNWNYYNTAEKMNPEFLNRYDLLMGANHGETTFLKYFNNSNPIWRRNLRAALHWDAIKANAGKSSTMTKLDNNTYLLNNYVNYNTNTGWVYQVDSSGNSVIKKVKLSDIQPDKVKDYWVKHIYKHEKGGILIPIAAKGMSSVDFVKMYSLNQKTTEQKAKVEAAKASGKTPEQAAHDTKSIKEFDLTGSDGVRLGAAIADLTGAVAAYIPGGSVYSLIQGIGSDIARAGADYSDGASGWDVAKNFGIGLAGTALASLPIVGTEGKIAKAWKGIRTFLPYLFSGVGVISTAGPAYKSYKKIEAGKGTLEDYTNILSFVTQATNGAKTVGNARKAHAIKKVADTGNSEITIAGKNGSIKLKLSELETLKQSTSRADMLAKLKTLPGHENDEIDFGHINGINPLASSLKPSGKHWYNQGASLTESPIYDFNRVGNKKYSTDVAMLQFKTPEIHFFDKLNLSYNPGKGYIAPKTTTKPVVTPEEPDVDDILAGTVAANKQGGRLEFVLSHRNGGIIKAQGGTSLHNVQRNPNWKYPALELARLYIADLLSGKLTADLFNSRQHQHAGFKSKYHPNPSSLFSNLTGEDPEVKEYQNWFNSSNYNTPIWNNYSMYNTSNKAIKGTTTNDKKDGYSADGYYGAITDTRHGGRDGDFDSSTLLDLKDLYKEAGYDYYLDTTDNYYKLRKLGTQQTSQQTGNSGGTINASNLQKPYIKNSSPNLYKYASEATKLADVIDATQTNKKMSDILMSQLAISKRGKFHVAPVDVTSFTIKLNGIKEAGKINDEARRLQNATASGRLGSGYRLAGISKAEDVKHDRNSEAQKYVQYYADQRVPVVNFNADEDIDANNYNNASYITLNNYNKQILAGLESALYTNVRSPYRQEHILDYSTRANDFETKQTAANQMALKDYYQNLINNDITYNNLTKLMKDAQAAGDTKKAQQYADYIAQLKNNYITRYYNDLYGKYGVNLPTYSPLNLITPIAKNGGTLEDNTFKARLKDNERFDKGILLMIKLNQKAIDNSTAITRAIISKLMSKL